MKIIRLCTFLDFGGLEQRLVNLSHIEDENEWIFCALGKGGAAAEQISKNGKKVILLEADFRIPSFKTIYNLIKLFYKERPDIVHTSGAEANFHGIIAAKLAGVKKLIAEEIGIPNQKFYHKKLSQFLFRFPEYIVSNSRIVGDYLLKENKIKKGKLKIIANPILSKPIVIPHANEKEFQLLTISRLIPVKNIEGIFRAISSLSKEGYSIKFTIIGEGPIRGKLNELATDLGIISIIEFKGFIARPWEEVEKTNLFILNSFTEGFSNALAEAMAAGVPCLATKVGAAEDMIEDGVSGWLVNQGDDAELYAKLKSLMNKDKAELKKIGLIGRLCIMSKFTIKEHVKNLLELYQH